IGDAHDVDPQALRTLFARLELRGVVRALTPVFDTYQLPLAADVESVAAALGPGDGSAWRDLVAAGRRGRLWLTLDLSRAAAMNHLGLEHARQILRRAEEEGLVALRATGTLQRYEIVSRPVRASDLSALLDSVRDALAGEHLLLTAVRDSGL